MDYEQLSSIVMDASEKIIYVVDPETYELVYLNKNAMMLFGEKAERYRGRKCYEVLNGLDAPCPFCNNSSLTKDKFVKWVHYNKYYNVHLSVQDKLVEIDGKDYRLEIATDVTTVEHTRKALQVQLNLQKTLLKCVQTLSEEDDINHAIDNLLSIVGRFYRADRAYIFEFDYKNDVVVNTFEWCKDGIEPQIDELQEVPSDAVDRWVEEFELHGEIFITSLGKGVDSDSLEYQILQPQGIESLIAAPMYYKGKLTGLIGVDNPSINIDQADLLKSIALFVQNDLVKAEMNKKLYDLSYKDMLTGVGNRNLYISVIEAMEKNPPDNLGVVFVDINGLKVANDKFGHDYGDRMIKSAADGMKEIFGAEKIYRIGGDEFVAFILEDTREEFEKKVLKLREFEENECICKFSIGVNYSEEKVDVTQQLIHSDSMMYSEKQQYYSKKHHDRRNKDHYLAKELYDDISSGKFKVYLQPKIDLKTEQLVGAEALVRKIDNDGNVIPPNKFIPLLEAEGIVEQIDFFVLDNVCRILKRWEDEGHKPIKISINFSRITLMESEIVERIKSTVEGHGISPKNIVIEVTESVSKMSDEYLKRLTGELEAAGFILSLDDFGAKYSNLSILTNVDFKELKMDKSLIDNITTNQKTQIVVLHSINVCKDLDGVTATAEGIEYKEQLQILKDLDCQVGQGYFFSKPISIDEFHERYIADR